MRPRITPASFFPALLADIQRAETGMPTSTDSATGKTMARPTGEFLSTLAGILSRHWGRPVDASQAWQAWQAAGVICERAQRATRELADLSFWYGFDCFALSPARQMALALNLPRVQSQHRLLNQLYDPTDYDGVYQLTLLAYDDEQAALAARAEAMRALIEATRK